MSSPDWRATRVLGIAVAWIIGMSVWTVVRSYTFPRTVQPNSTDDLYVIARVPGGVRLMLGPPLAMIAAWLWLRRARRSN
jgi:hypothetical protein